jgi:hypothetical protein
MYSFLQFFYAFRLAGFSAEGAGAFRLAGFSAEGAGAGWREQGAWGPLNTAYQSEGPLGPGPIFPGSSSRMPRLEIVITCLPGPPSCAPRRCVLDDSSHTSCHS